MAKKQVVSETEKPVRTRSLGELRWYSVAGLLLEPISGGPFADVSAAESWLKGVLAEGILVPGVYELHRVVKRVEPRRVEVLRFEW